MAYIERESAIKSLLNDCLGQVSYSREDAADCIFWLDTADVAPVRHGRWEKQSGLYSCSECGMTCPYDVQADVIEYWTCNYCPECGAEMDLEDGEDNNANKEID